MLPRGRLSPLVAVSCLVAVAAQCDSPSCQFQLLDSDGVSHSFDLSSACMQLSDEDLHRTAPSYEYYTQVCGRLAFQECAPVEFDVALHQGTVVQAWGGTPDCPSPERNCSTEGHPSECCTRNCEVLGGPPEDVTWALVDGDNPQSGGIIGRFPVVPRIYPDNILCQHNTVSIVMKCNPRVQDTAFTNVYQNLTNIDDVCVYFVELESPDACAVVELSWGWITVTSLLIVWSVYILVGMAVTLAKENIWAYPHRTQWLAFKNYVADGVRYLVSGCKPLRAHRS